MNLAEVNSLLELLSSYYPNSNNYEQKYAKNWNLALHDVDAKELVRLFLKAYMSGDFGEYPPQLHQLLALIRSTQPQPPKCFEELSPKSNFRKRIGYMVKRRFPSYSKKHQFSSVEEMQKSVAIRRDQQLKASGEVFNQYIDELWRLVRAGVPEREALIRVLGAHNVPQNTVKALPDTIKQTLQVATKETK